MSAHYVVSDAHFGAAPPEDEERFLAFCESLRGRADSLFVLGDLLDFWFEYGRAIPKHGFRALAELVHLRRGGTRVVYLAGNHDLRFRDFLGRELGIEAASQVSERLDGSRVWMSHGDEVDHRAVPALFRRLMRSRINNLLYSFVHPDVGIGFASWVASRSRARGQDDFLRGVMARHASRKLAEGYDIVVTGHLHVPELVRLDGGWYLRTAWCRGCTYGVIRDGVPALERFRA